VASYPQDRVIHNSIHRFIHRFYPSYPQVYPQVALVSVGTYDLHFLFWAIFIHRLRELSTETVDNSDALWKLFGQLSTGFRRPVDGLWKKQAFNAYFVLQIPDPGGGG
jgi:hypothetical protein